MFACRYTSGINRTDATNRQRSDTISNIFREWNWLVFLREIRVSLTNFNYFQGLLAETSVLGQSVMRTSDGDLLIEIRPIGIVNDVDEDVDDDDDNDDDIVDDRRNSNITINGSNRSNVVVSVCLLYSWEKLI